MKVSHLLQEFSSSCFADRRSESKGERRKSTTALHLARWLQRQGRSVHLADLDPQQTGSFWLQAGDQFTIPCTVIPADADAALEQLPPLAAAADGLVVDHGAPPANAQRNRQ